MGKRYYTLAFMDLYGKPHHLGTRTNGGKATRYALVGPSGGTVPEGYEAFRLPTDTAWMLGRVLVTDKRDEAEAKRLSAAIVIKAEAGPEVTAAEPMRPFDSLEYFVQLNQALKSVPAVPGEEALMAAFDRAGFGPHRTFDPGKLSAGQALGLGCALKNGPGVLDRSGFRPTRSTNGWLLSNAAADPGFDYPLRAQIARGGYVNAPEESIYPAAITDSAGGRLSGEHRYRIHFAAGSLPPVDGFWSITAYDLMTSMLVENGLRRYSIGDRTKGMKFGKDGSLDIYLSNARPPQGASNWLPVPPGLFHVVTRLYLPHREALDGRYELPVIERID